MIREVELTRGHVALVDDADYPLVADFKWSVSIVEKRWIYARTVSQVGVGEPRRIKWVFMHRLLTNAPRSHVVDHWDGDGLNNRRANLRVCTRSQNNGNVRVIHSCSGFKGVYWDPFCYRRDGSKYPRPKPWKVQILADRKYYFLGRFSTPEEGGLVYDAAAIRLLGQFAATNAELRA